MATRTPPQRRPKSAPPKKSAIAAIADPEMRVTQYDRASAMMIAVVIGLILLLVWLMAVWFTNLRPATDDTAPIELIQMGGWEDGAPDETLEVDSPDPEIPDPSLAPVEDPIEQKQELIETVLEQSDVATQLAEKQFENAAVTTGKPGSATGSGRRPLGVGGGGEGVPDAQRWMIVFNDKDSLQEYAEALDYFGIKIVVVNPRDRKFYEVSNMAAGRPTVQTFTENSRYKGILNFNWKSGTRKLSDVKLLKKAGVDGGAPSIILHIYNTKLRRQLTQIEFDYQKQPIKNIRRTYFMVRSRGGKAYEFVVTRQLLLQ